MNEAKISRLFPPSFPQMIKDINTLITGGANNRNQINLAELDCTGLNFVHHRRETKYHIVAKKVDVRITVIDAGS